MTLNDLEEQRGSVLRVLRKQLQQVAVVVKVYQNAQLLKLKTPHHRIVNDDSLVFAARKAVSTLTETKESLGFTYKFTVCVYYLIHGNILFSVV